MSKGEPPAMALIDKRVRLYKGLKSVIGWGNG